MLPKTDSQSSTRIDDTICNPPFLQAVINYLRLFFIDNRKASIVLLYSVIALTFWKYIPSAPSFADSETGKIILLNKTSTPILPLDGSLSFSTLDFLWNSRKIWCAFLIMGLLPALIVKFIFKENISDYGMRLSLKKTPLVHSACVLPFFLLVGWTSGYTKDFYQVYPYNPLSGVSWEGLFIHTALYLLLYYTAWEFMFRGFIQLGLKDSIGPIPSILVQVLASTMLHYGHPSSETFGCIIGGLFWGFLVYRTKSLWAGWGQHALLGIALDWSLILNAC